MCSNTWTPYVHKLSVFTVTAGSVEIEFLIVCVCVYVCPPAVACGLKPCYCLHVHVYTLQSS